MGDYSRRKVEKDFDEKLVFQAYQKTIKEIFETKKEEI
jgi:hypothetical protein